MSLQNALTVRPCRTCVLDQLPGMYEANISGENEMAPERSAIVVGATSEENAEEILREIKSVMSFPHFVVEVAGNRLVVYNNVDVSGDPYDPFMVKLLIGNPSHRRSPLNFRSSSLAGSWFDPSKLAHEMFAQGSGRVHVVGTLHSETRHTAMGSGIHAYAQHLQAFGPGCEYERYHVITRKTEKGTEYQISGQIDCFNPTSGILSDIKCAKDSTATSSLNGSWTHQLQTYALLVNLSNHIDVFADRSIVKKAFIKHVPKQDEVPLLLRSRDYEIDVSLPALQRAQNHLFKFLIPQAIDEYLRLKATEEAASAVLSKKGNPAGNDSGTPAAKSGPGNLVDALEGLEI
jgi:hypothetical protein